MIRVFVEHLPTIQRVLADQEGAVILMSHLGRPSKKLKEDGTIDVERFTLRHIVNHLSGPYWIVPFSLLRRRQ